MKLYTWQVTVVHLIPSENIEVYGCCCWCHYISAMQWSARAWDSYRSLLWKSRIISCHSKEAWFKLGLHAPYKFCISELHGNTSRLHHFLQRALYCKYLKGRRLAIGGPNLVGLSRYITYLELRAGSWRCLVEQQCSQ